MTGLFPLGAALGNLAGLFGFAFGGAAICVFLGLAGGFGLLSGLGYDRGGIFSLLDRILFGEVFINKPEDARS
ncbi:MAG: hypothetical protein J6386_23195 [Candidatus Synoicihabitans palmerolidicus]|nr:hypothetical protein [Candidatus Synoicihabitans palmerolidicus]